MLTNEPNGDHPQTETADHANGARYGNGLNGAGSESSTGREAEQVPTEAKNTVEIYTAEQLKSMEFLPVKFILDGIMAEGCTILGGRPKMGKSWLALDLALGVATGQQVMGRECEQGDVLYCALEDNRRRIQDRLRSLTRDNDDDCDWPSSLHFANVWPKGPETILAFHAWRKSVKNPKLIIVDTLKKVKSKPSGKQGENYFEDYEAVELLQKFYLDTGISVMLLTHTRKADADDPFDLITGTLGQTGAADNIMVMERAKGGAITLHGTGRDMEEYSHGVRFNKDACKWEIEWDAGPTPKTRKQKLSKAQDDALKAIRKVFDGGNSFEHHLPKFLGVGAAAPVSAIRESDAEAIFKTTHSVNASKPTDVRNALRMAWKRALDGLCRKGIVKQGMHRSDAFLWLNPFSDTHLDTQ